MADVIDPAEWNLHGAVAGDAKHNSFRHCDNDFLQKCIESKNLKHRLKTALLKRHSFKILRIIYVISK